MNKYRDIKKNGSPVPLTLMLTIGLAFAAHPALAQQALAAPSTAPVGALTTAPPANEASAPQIDKVQNGYAENLRPTMRKKPHGASPPYEPIRKQEDMGQIPEVDMFVGESRVFKTPNVGRIAVGNGQIMTAAALDNKEVIIFANAAGTSSLFIWNADGRYQRLKINIVAGDTSRIAREVATFLTTIPHAKASVVGDKVIVEGDSLSDADLIKIEMLEKRYPQVVNFTNRIGWEQMVMMDVKVVEFPRSELRELGLKWGAVGGTTLAAIWSPIRRGSDGPYTVNIPAGTSGLPITNPNSSQGVLLPSALNLLSGFNLGLNAQLNLLEQQGKASVLAEPQLSARNGAKASFLAGGEFPYSVSNVNGVTVNFKSYGIKLDVTPKVDRNGVIRATIQAEVSSIDASVSSPSGPALITRRTDTEFNVRSGETIVLSGLLQRTSSTDIDKVPLLGDIPILGALFRSKRFQNKETELVVFVTPSVVDSQSPGLVDRVQRTTERLAEQMGPQPYLSDPLQPGKPASDVSRRSALPMNTAPKTLAEERTVTPGSSTAAAVPSISATAAAAPSGNDRKIETVAANQELLQVQKEQTPIHAAPNANSDVLLQLGRGAVVHVDKSIGLGNLINGWRPVVVGQLHGWIAGAATVKFNEAAMIIPDTQNNLAHAARDGQVVGTTAAATMMMPTAPAVTDAANPLALPRYRVILDGLAMRVSPNINAMTVTQLNRGSVVEALPERAQGFWCAVQVAGRRGWIPLQWVMPLDAVHTVR